jgi:methyl-accepting chemotaxis protein
MKKLGLLNKSLKMKFVLIFSFLLVVISCIHFYNNYSAQKKESLNFAKTRLSSISEMLAFSVGAGFNEGNFDMVQTAFEWSKKDMQIVYIDIMDVTGTSVVVHNPNNITVDKGAALAQTQIININNNLIVSSPIVYKDKKLGSLIMAFSLEQMNSELTSRMYSSLILTVITFFLGIGIVYFICKMMTKQIIQLKNAAVKVGKGDLSVQIDVKSNDEIGQLAQSLQTMALNIKEGSEQLLSEKSKAESAMQEAELQKNNFAQQQDYLSKKIDFILAEMNNFADGDLTVALEIEKEDEIGKLYEGFNKAVQNIKTMLTKVSAAVAATTNASKEISSNTEQMAAGAQEQSGQTKEVAGAVEQMTKTILETTKNSTSASEAAKKAGSIAKEGGNVVAETITGMDRIAQVVRKSAETVHALGKSSDQIGEIVQVIDDIADQTNLLALNAAIEAARAGEQGRGFAVVADEVRKLAERTTKATKEIASMIKQIQKDTVGAVSSMEEGTREVEKGKKLADKAGESLSQIIKGAEQVVDIITQVAAASGEQSSTSEQISKSIEAINNVTQETSAGIMEIANASGELNKLTSNLNALIGQFRTDEK